MTEATVWQVVVIDDEADIREVVSFSLVDAGYDVLTAEDGEHGLDLCLRTNPQLVITDIRMPRLDGLQVLERLKQERPDTEVIVATAFGEMDLAIRALQLDASDFITKPISDETLHLALKRARERYLAKQGLRAHTALLEREKAETAQELSRTVNFMKNLIQMSMDGILGLDEDGRVMIINGALQRATGQPAGTVIGKAGLDLFFSPGDLENFLATLAEEKFGGPGRISLYETHIRTREGGRIPVQLSAVRLEKGVAGGLVIFFRDLREIRALEREMADQARILHQDKMISLGRLAAGAAHEINNPLAGVLNYVRLMLRVVDRDGLGPEQIRKFRSYLELVESETARCTEIVSSLLAFSRKSPAQFAKVHVEHLLNRCAVLSRHKLELAGIELQVNADRGLPDIDGDFNQLQQAILNLLFNAADALPGGGGIDLEADRGDEDGMISIRVRDTGLGIRPEDRPHIFEPFFTTKREGDGIGLGLSTVYGIVERHNGSVLVSSNPGEGSVFTLLFPVALD